MAISPQALEYAKKNPNDPLSQEILRRAKTTPQQSPFNSNFVEASKGFGKTVVSTLQNTGNLVLSPFKAGLNKLGVKTQETGFTQDELKLQNPAQEVGGVAAEIAMFLAPTGTINRAEKALGVTGRTLGAALGRGAVEGVTTGATVAAQRGQFDEESKRAALIAAAFPVGFTTASKILNATTGKVVGKTGEELLYKIIKPSVKDVKAGFDIKNIRKHDLGGSLPRMLHKTELALQTKGNLLKKELQGSDEFVDLAGAYERTLQRLTGKDKIETFGQNLGVKRALSGLKGELDEFGRGQVGLWEATQVKRAAGRKGAWVDRFPDPDANAVEEVYDTFYDELKKEIERLGTPAVKKLNKELSEIIPIERALVRRIPVAERQNMFSLTDHMGLIASAFDPRALAVIGASRLSGNGKFANWLIKVSEKAGREPRTAIGQRMVGSPTGTSPEASLGLAMKDVSKNPVSVAKKVDREDLKIIRDYLAKPQDIKAFELGEKMIDMIGIRNLEPKMQKRFLREVLDNLPTTKIKVK